MLSTKDIKVKFLGITPVWQDDSGMMTPQQLVAFSGLLTYSGKSIGALVQDAKDKGQDIDKKISGILRASSLKGHASMSTTPVISFSYEASKFLDSALTGIVFSSSIMASGRRTDTAADDIVYPESILQKPEALEIYHRASQKNIENFNWLLAQNVQKDEASKILQYGIYGTGIIQLPVESIVSLKREYEAQKDWMPAEVGLLLEVIEKELKNYGVDLLYATRVVAPRNVYPYPNIFKNPSKINFVREMAKNCHGRDFKIISGDFCATPGLENSLKKLDKKIKDAVANGKDLAGLWQEFLAERQAIVRDYGLSAGIKMFSSTAWRVWSEKKRHRTVPMIVDSIYHSAGVSAEVFKGYASQIREKKLSNGEIEKIGQAVSLPPSIKASSELLYPYLERALESFEAYANMIDMHIPARDALFAVPRALKLQMVCDYNLYNLIAGYYPLRVCATVDEELRRITIKETKSIKEYLNARGLRVLADAMVPKCFAAGFCLEQNTCGKVKELDVDYDLSQHRQMHNDLEKKYREILESINN